MKYFKATVTADGRTTLTSKEFIVDANSPEEAEEEIMNEACATTDAEWEKAIKGNF
jgi:hypothetical protein